MQGEAIEQVAAPFQSLAGSRKFQAGEIDDGTVGGVFAGNPLRVVAINFRTEWYGRVKRFCVVASSERVTVGGVAADKDADDLRSMALNSPLGRSVLGVIIAERLSVEAIIKVLCQKCDLGLL